MAPRVREVALLLVRRQRAQALHVTQGDRQREIAARPDIGTTQRHQVVDVHAPRPEAWNVE